MLDKVARGHSARNVLNDETLMAALDAVSDAIVKELLAATTTEDREAKYHEHKGLKALRSRLSSWKQDAPQT